MISHWITVISCSRPATIALNGSKNTNILQSNLVSRQNPSNKIVVLFRFTVNATIVALQIGICGVYFVFIGAHLKELSGQYLNFEASLITFILLLLIPIILISFVRTLKGIAVFSTIGNIIMVACLLFIFQVSMNLKFCHHLNSRA